IVDDASTDGTREVLQGLAKDAAGGNDGGGTASPPASPLPNDKMRFLFPDHNRGKGAAPRTGVNAAKSEVILVQDADLEYDPQDYFSLLDPIQRGVADVVYGSRFHGGPHRVLYFWHYAANKFLGLLSSVFTNLNLSDVWSCYKVFPRRVLEK